MDGDELEKGAQDRRYISRGSWIYLSGLLLRLGARVPLLLIAGHGYGASLYGEFIIAQGLVETAAATATLGFKRTLFSFMHETGEQPVAAVRHALVISVTLGCLFSAGLTVLAPFLAQLFGVAEAAGKIAVFAWIVPVIIVTDMLITATFFNRQLRYDIWSRCVAAPGVQTLVAAAFFFAGFKAVGLMAAYVASYAAAVLTAAWGYSREFDARATWGKIEFPRLIRMMRSSGSTAIFDVMGVLTTRLDMFVIGHFFSAQSVGLYGMAQQFLTLPDQVAKSFVPVVMPVISNALHHKDLKRARDALAALAPRQAMLEGILIIAFIAGGPFLLGLFGKDFAAAAMVLAILAAGQIINDLLSLAGLPLVVARPNINPSAAIVTLVFYGVAVGFAQSSFGIEGIAVISVVAALIGNLWRSHACYQVLFPPSVELVGGAAE